MMRASHWKLIRGNLQTFSLYTHLFYTLETTRRRASASLLSLLPKDCFAAPWLRKLWRENDRE